jgi:hypothetical protein
MNEKVSPDRLAELHKHAAEQCQDPDLLSANPIDHPNHIKALARSALGIHPMMEIDDIPQPEHTEVLIIMTSIRDNLYPKQGTEL